MTPPCRPSCSPGAARSPRRSRHPVSCFQPTTRHTTQERGGVHGNEFRYVARGADEATHRGPCPRGALGRLPCGGSSLARAEYANSNAEGRAHAMCAALREGRLGPLARLANDKQQQTKANRVAAAVCCERKETVTRQTPRRPSLLKNGNKQRFRREGSAHERKTRATVVRTRALHTAPPHGYYMCTAVDPSEPLVRHARRLRTEETDY